MREVYIRATNAGGLYKGGNDPSIERDLFDSKMVIDMTKFVRVDLVRESMAEQLNR